MTTPNENQVPDDVPVVEPDEVLDPTEVEVTSDALEAAKAELAQEQADAKQDVKQRTLRTAVQSAVAAGVAAGVPLYEHGVHDWRVLGWAFGQAALAVLVTYVHGKVLPAKSLKGSE